MAHCRKARARVGAAARGLGGGVVGWVVVGCSVFGCWLPLRRAAVAARGRGREGRGTGGWVAFGWWFAIRLTDFSLRVSVFASVVVWLC